MRKCIQKKTLSSFDLTPLALLITGVFIWVVFVSGLTQPFVIDDSTRIVEKSDLDDFQDTSSLYLPYTAVKETGSSFLSDILCLPFFFAVGFLLTNAVFRLKLVLLTPHRGPPETFFATGRPEFESC
jgi:hypothetical protein